MKPVKKNQTAKKTASTPVPPPVRLRPRRYSRLDLPPMVTKLRQSSAGSRSTSSSRRHRQLEISDSSSSNDDEPITKRTLLSSVNPKRKLGSPASSDDNCEQNAAAAECNEEVAQSRLVY